MGLDQVMEESRIEFARSLDLKETEKLLEYLTNKMCGRITYHISSFKNLSIEDNRLGRDNGTVKINGNIMRENPVVFDAFETEHDNDDTSRIRGIRFMLIPGYDMDDYGRERRELWSHVKKDINDYFLPR
jgi:hypothetical protein